MIALPTPEIPQGESRRRLLREYGAFVNSLGGLYSAAPDMNTSALDMDIVGEVTAYVFCRTEAAGGSGDTAPDTALGVFHGIRAACRYAFGSDDLSRRSVLVQGAGGVGGHLIELLMEADAKVIATDVDALPDLELLAGNLAESLDELAAAAGLPPRRGARPANGRPVGAGKGRRPVART